MFIFFVLRYKQYTYINKHFLSIFFLSCTHFSTPFYFNSHKQHIEQCLKKKELHIWIWTKNSSPFVWTNWVVYFRANQLIFVWTNRLMFVWINQLMFVWTNRLIFVWTNWLMFVWTNRIMFVETNGLDVCQIINRYIHHLDTLEHKCTIYKCNNK